MTTVNETSHPPVHGPVRVHCGYHKCLTMYSRRVYKRACHWMLPPRRGFRHFYHWADRFYAECTRYRVASVSGHAVQLDRFEDVRVVRFIRDPRDLLVSGYHYHLKGVEPWSTRVDPTPDVWRQVGGVIPSMLPPGASMQSFLAEAPLEVGMAAELEFRTKHFDSMREWPDGDSRVRLFRYEDILGNEVAVFEEIFDFFELPRLARARGRLYARRHAAGRRAADSGHIRDARAGQWRDVLPDAVVAEVAARYGDVLDRYGYPRA